MSDEPIDHFTPEEEAALCSNLDSLLREVGAGAFSERALSLSFVQSLHARIFDGVRDYAGRCRNQGGPEHLLIMGRRAPHRNEVQKLCERALSTTEARIRNLAESGAPSAAAVVSVAVGVHVELAKIQPFTDGNKRTARTVLDIVLVRLGFDPVAFTVPRKEYVDALREAFDGSPRLLEDLVIDILAARLEALDS